MQVSPPAWQQIQLYVQHRHFRIVRTQIYESEKEYNPIVYTLGSHESLKSQQSMDVEGFMVGDIPCHQWPPNDELPNPLKPLEIRSNLQLDSPRVAGGTYCLRVLTSFQGTSPKVSLHRMPMNLFILKEIKDGLRMSTNSVTKASTSDHLNRKVPPLGDPVMLV